MRSADGKRARRSQFMLIMLTDGRGVWSLFGKQSAGASGGGMPIKAEMRWFYPIDWPQLSRHVRFERAGGVCQGCGRPHGAIIRVLPDGRWHDDARQTWRNYRGRPARWPDIKEAARIRQTRV